MRVLDRRWPGMALLVLMVFTRSAFAEPPAAPQAALLETADGSLYGTTSRGGVFDVGDDALNSAGTVFKIDASGDLTTLHSFSGADGGRPMGELIETADGNFYGTTQSGGASDLGTVFKIDPTGNLTTLHSFSGADGGRPTAGLIEAADRSFYGTTSSGGGADRGTVFKMDPSGDLATLHSFSGPDGATPFAELIQTEDGSFYGTTSSGGGDDLGTVFKIDLPASSPRSLSAATSSATTLPTATETA